MWPESFSTETKKKTAEASQIERTTVYHVNGLTISERLATSSV